MPKTDPYILGVMIMKLFKKALVATAVCTAVILLFAFPKEIQQGIAEGLELCGGIIIPSLFPFMVLAGFISRSGAAFTLARPIEGIVCALFRIPKEASGCLLLSLIGGYPVGASSVAMLCAQGYVDRKTAGRMLGFCANAGPAMAIIAVGKGMLGNIYAGWVIYLSHIAAALLTGFISARFAPPVSKEKSPQKEPHQNLADAFVGSVSDASLQMLTVCGYVALFAAVTALLKSQNGDFLSPLIEVTCGTKWAARAGMPASVLCAVLSFGGLSVICQISSLSHGLIPFKRLILSRIINGLLGWVICSGAIKLLPQSLQVISNTSGQALGFWPISVPLSLSMLIMAAIFLTTLSQKSIN